MSTLNDFLDDEDRLLTPGEVAALFRVNSRTVRLWAEAGRLSAIRTPGQKRLGHRRYRESQVRELLAFPDTTTTGDPS